MDKAAAAAAAAGTKSGRAILATETVAAYTIYDVWEKNCRSIISS